MTENSAQHHLAAIDVGSNSIHLVIARAINGELRTVDKLSEKIRLGAGIGSDRCLTAKSQQRALDCLSRYQQRISHLPSCDVRIVGTNALRIARNSAQFCEQAQTVLNHPLEIISGREEARLIYLGVAHTLADDEEKRLVVDIGGGSSEFILGEKFEPYALESLHMGCLSYQQRFFPDGLISAEGFEKAERSARLELLNIDSRYKQIGWKHAIGSSGTVKAVEQVGLGLGLSGEGITRQGLELIKQRVLSFSHCQQIDLDGVPADRQYIFASGLAILIAIFDALKVEVMEYSAGALREGVLYDLIGRRSHEDVRDRSVRALMHSYQVDEEQAKRVAKSALEIYDLVAEDWGIELVQYRELLKWAAFTHEVGLNISHSQFQKHGAYILQHSDLPGFARWDQAALALLVRRHRRKFIHHETEDMSEHWQRALRYLCTILRLSVLFNRCRKDTDLPSMQIKVGPDSIHLGLAKEWLHRRSLTAAELVDERKFLSQRGVTFDF